MKRTPTPIELVEKAAESTTQSVETMARVYGVPVGRVREIVAAVRK